MAKRILSNDHRITAFVLAVSIGSIVVIGCSHKPRNMLSDVVPKDEAQDEKDTKKDDHVSQSKLSAFLFGSNKESAQKDSRGTVTANEFAKTPSDEADGRKVIQAKHTTSTNRGLVLTPFIRKRPRNNETANDSDRGRAKNHNQSAEIELLSHIARKPSARIRRNPFVDTVSDETASDETVGDKKLATQSGLRKLRGPQAPNRPKPAVSRTPQRENVFVDGFNSQLKRLRTEVDDRVRASDSEDPGSIRDGKSRRLQALMDRTKSEMNNTALANARRTTNTGRRQLGARLLARKEASHAHPQLHDHTTRTQVGNDPALTAGKRADRPNGMIVESSAVPSQFNRHTVTLTGAVANSFGPAGFEGPMIVPRRKNAAKPFRVAEAQNSLQSQLARKTTVGRVNANSAADLNANQARISTDVASAPPAPPEAAVSFYPALIGNRPDDEAASEHRSEPPASFKLDFPGNNSRPSTDIPAEGKSTTDPNRESRQLETVNWDVEPEAATDGRSISTAIPLIAGFLLGISCLIGIHLYRRLPRRFGGRRSS